MNTYKLDGVDITRYIESGFEYSEEKSLEGEDNIRLPAFSLQLWNHGGMFNKYEPNSIWYNCDQTESFLTIYDEYDSLIYTGKIKSWEYNNSKNMVTCNVVSELDTIFDTTFLYFEYDKTPAENIYQILINAGLGSLLDMHSYNNARILQEDNGLLVDCNFNIENTTTIYQAIQQLSNMAGCDCFLSGGKIFLYQNDRNAICNSWITVPYNSILTPAVLSDDPEKVYNQYAYETDLLTVRDTEYAKASREKWGTRSFSSIGVNNQNQISSIAIVGLVWAGEERITPLLNPQNYIEFSVDSRRFPFPLSVQDTFKFDNYCEQYIGYNIDSYNWQVLQVSGDNNKLNILAVRK